MNKGQPAATNIEDDAQPAFTEAGPCWQGVHPDTMVTENPFVLLNHPVQVRAWFMERFGSPLNKPWTIAHDIIIPEDQRTRACIPVSQFEGEDQVCHQKEMNPGKCTGTGGRTTLTP